VCGCVGVGMCVWVVVCVDSSEDSLMSLLSTITAVSGVCRCGCVGVWVYWCMGVCVWVCVGVCV